LSILNHTVQYIARRLPTGKGRQSAR
jgi:hypothetical protein